MTVTIRYGGIAAYSAPAIGIPAGPFLSVRLRNGGRYYDTFGLVDSGADQSMFNSQHALALGLALDPALARVGSGVGGHTQIWVHQIDLVVAGRTITAPVAFSPGCPPGFGLLGRADFFDRFQIGIEQRNARLLYHALP